MITFNSVRPRLIHLVEEIQTAQDLGEDYTDLLTEAESLIPFPDLIAEFLDSDYSPECIADLCLGWQDPWPTLSREELIELVSKIMSAEGSEAEQMILDHIFEANCAHPAMSNLIYYPDEVFGDGVEPTALQVVEKAIAGE